MNNYNENLLNGWIKIYRNLESHWIWKNDKYFKAWIWILFRVNRAENRVLIGNELLTVQPGEFITSIQRISEATGLSFQQVRTLLNLLVKDGMIVKESNTKLTRIKVINSGIYQSTKQTDNKPLTNAQQTFNNRQENKNKRVKENNYISIFEKFRVKYPGTKRGLQTEFDNFIKKHKDFSVIVEVLLPFLENQIKIREVKKQAGEFVPQWKNLQTYINQRCWEEEVIIEANAPKAVIKRKL